MNQSSPPAEKRLSPVMKTIYAGLMLAAVFIVIGGKFPSISGSLVVAEPAGTCEGDLYRLCAVERFRESIPVADQAPSATFDRAEILVLGDSFFNSTLGSDIFANVLAEKSGRSVSNLTSDTFFEPFSYPLAFLEHIGYRPDRRRILVLESVERSSLDRTANFGGRGGGSANLVDGLAFKVLKNNDVEFFFKNNRVTYPFIRQLKNLRFTWFGIIDGSIGAYSLNPDMLFYRRDLDFAARPKPGDTLDRAADRVARLSETLRSRFNLDLLFVIVPDKYSVYRDYAGNSPPYDRYIPRFTERLRTRGVHTVDLYTAYMDSRRNAGDLLYYESDTHFTPRGKSILADECLREIAAMEASDSVKTLRRMGSGQRIP